MFLISQRKFPCFPINCFIKNSLKLLCVSFSFRVLFMTWSWLIIKGECDCNICASIGKVLFWNDFAGENSQFFEIPIFHWFLMENEKLFVWNCFFYFSPGVAFTANTWNFRFHSYFVWLFAICGKIKSRFTLMKTQKAWKICHVSFNR